MLRLGIVVGGGLLRHLWLRDLVCSPRNNLVHSSGATVLRRELTGLERALHENVVALFVRGGDGGEVAVEHQAVPVRVLLGLIVAVRVAVAFSHPSVRDGCS